ncbi:MAG: hypothetical protein E6J70_16420 [Deltaproteobacteria bacterium]|nr:MAG: hypothetical protein E6J70_16420 [Deltaproteobacteria bacterium]
MIAELADAAERHPLAAGGSEEPDLLTVRGDAAEVRDAVGNRAAALAVHALGQEAAHRRLQVEHQVLPELTARVAEHGAAGRGRQQAEARRFDRARGQHEGARGCPLPPAGVVHVLDGAHVAALVHEADRRGVEAKLAAPTQERAPECRHGG